MNESTAPRPIKGIEEDSAFEEALTAGVLEPPADVPVIYRNNWFSVPGDSPVVAYVVEKLWERSKPPLEWEAARLSKAAYLYRETTTQWTVLVKFYAGKVGPGPASERYANKEFLSTQRAQASVAGDESIRVVRPLAAWRGVLFLEYVDGLTLEDFVAIRRNRPGTLLPALEQTAQLLARLHANSTQPEAKPDIQWEVNDAREFAGVLAQSGVLAGEPLVYQEVLRLIERRATDPDMQKFIPASIHGDATSSNFVFPWTGGLVAIDWERMKLADPASDLGRLMAEFSHSINRYGGDTAEATPLLEYLLGCYRKALPSDWDAEALVKRARFYQGTSTLRIARNGWLSREERAALVAQAMALLN